MIANENTYRYVFIPPVAATRPYLLFLHGWPSSSFDWRFQIEYFRQCGYGIIAPDLLGYGGTSKPDDLDSYRYKNMAADMAAVLDCEGISRVHGIGHDL